MRIKIYTKTGDSGKTSIYGGVRVFKNDTRVSAYGTVDELNSFLGIVLTKIENEKICAFINDIQKDLFIIGSFLAGAKLDLLILTQRVGEMETMIDWMDEKLPELKNFILPEGVESASFLFYARAVARRCERAIVELNQKEPIDKNVLVYINRLSDLLFEMARYMNFKKGIEETIWKSK